MFHNLNTTIKKHCIDEHAGVCPPCINVRTYARNSVFKIPKSVDEMQLCTFEPFDLSNIGKYDIKKWEE